MRPDDLGIGRLIERIRDAVIVADAETQRIVLWSSAAENVFGYSSSEAQKLRIEALVPEYPTARHRPGMAHPAETRHGACSGSHELLEVPAFTKSGEEIHVEMSLSHLGAIGEMDDDNGGQFVVAMIRDVTERNALGKRFEHQTFHDPLTDLPNRTLFMRRLEHVLARTETQEAKVALLLMDLDNFKYVNDSLGPMTGDLLLIEAAERLQSCFGSEGLLSRLDGDEYALLLDDVEDVFEAEAVAARLAEEMTLPFALEGQGVFVTTSIGVAMGISGHDHAEVLLKNADIAMYEDKRKGRNGYEVREFHGYLIPLSSQARERSQASCRARGVPFALPA